MTDQKTIRWGFLSTAGIGRKNWQAIHASGNGVIAAVASRDVGKAQAYIDECQAEARFAEAPGALGSYEELLARPDLDAVYIPLPTGLRKEWVIKAARAGKHVMCEKPCAITAADLEEMIAACRESKVQFMDGVMFMHTGRLPAIREALDAGEIGTIRRIATHFSFNAPDDFLEGNIRMNSRLEPQGCLGDLGWYTIRMTLWTLDYEMPERVSARILNAAGRADSPDAVPLQFSAELFFPSGVTANFYNSFQTEHQQTVTISGTEGYLHLSDFVLPFYDSELGFDITRSSFEVDGCRFNMARGRTHRSVPEYANNHDTAQETLLFRRFADLALAGEPDDHWPGIALKTQRVLDACLESGRADGKMVTLI